MLGNPAARAISPHDTDSSTMIRYAVVAFPETSSLDAIESLRARYDPQAKLIPAHITLVFPFVDDFLIPDLDHMVREAATGIAPIDLVFDGVSEASGGYVFLDIIVGREKLIALHDRLYRGRLARHLSREHTYRPHLTLGHIADPAVRQSALTHATETIARVPAIIRTLSVFRIESPTQGHVEGVIPLNAAARKE